MKNPAIHFCQFDSTLDIKGKNRTYEVIKARVLEAGRFSIFEVTESPRDIWRFEQLHKDPDLETYELQFPWIGIRRREARESDKPMESPRD